MSFDTMTELLLGWALGIGSSLISVWGVSKLRLWQKKKNFMRTLRIELREALLLLATQHHLFSDDLGQVSRQSLEWLYPIYSTLRGEKDKLTQGIKKWLEKSDAKISSYNAAVSIQAKSDSIPKRVNLFYLERELGFVTHLNPAIQAQITEVRRLVEAFNEEIPRYMWYFQKTFDPSLSQENCDLTKQNLNSTKRGLLGFIQNTADKMANLISELGNALGE